MSTSPDSNNEKSQCRLCAQPERSKHLFDIFGKEGSKHNLDAKIRKCLPIVVQEDDGMPRLVCIDCINRLDMVAVFVESCMRAHHQFLRVQTNDPSKRVAPAVHTDEQDEDDGNDDIMIKSEPNVGDDDIDLDDLPHVLRSKDNNPMIAQVFSIDPEESNEPVASVFIKAEPVEVNMDE